MNTLQRMTSALVILAASALLGAGCASSDESATAGNDTEEGATLGSVQEAQDYGRGYGGGGTKGPCAWLEDGAYCGGDQVPGNPNKLYRCLNGVQSVIQMCQYGCQSEPAGTPDHCY